MKTKEREIKFLSTKQSLGLIFVPLLSTTEIPFDKSANNLPFGTPSNVAFSVLNFPNSF